MARKHENFGWYGYKYTPESVVFTLNGKRLYLPDDERNKIAYLVICGRKREALDELKRILRKEEKQPLVIGKCICFFKRNSNEFYYTQQLQYQPDNIQDALRCYKEWKRYIKSKECILETGYEVTEGEFELCGDNKGQTRLISNVVDLTRCRSINIIRNNIFA